MISGLLELSVVVPVYGCRDCLLDLHRRLTEQLESITPEYEIILVDDRSPDGSWSVLKTLAASDHHVKAVRLSRNFGQHNAITAGLAASQGSWTIVMDCDLQDPPEEIPNLYEAARHGGYDLVLARRLARSNSRLRVVLGRVYFKLLNAFMGTHIDGTFGTFSILSRKVVNAYMELGDRDRHYLFVLQWLGFEQGTIQFEQAPRASGGSSYTLAGLIRHAVRGVFFQTSNVLLYIVYFGFLLAGGGILLAVYDLVLVAVAHPPPGYTSVMVVMIIIGGFIIVSTGVTGMYIGRVFEQVKGRPLYVIDEIAQKGESVTKSRSQRREVETVH
jgi:glycosyltransferase involved in cell wall biosynthesis